MKFIDEVKIEAKAGDGGPGSRSFRREKFVPRGGPDGGNGGNGGSIIIQSESDKHTLLDLKYRPRWHAENGKAGEGSRKDGRSGEDLVISVPCGTQVLDEKGELICDLDKDNERLILLSGGKGGKGNVHFKSATNRTPDYAQPGEEGGSKIFTLSLKLIADIGLMGLPNAGKSTLISKISSARPKVADYPFTTLVPNLGVVKPKSGRPFVVADIPGLVPGAHTGKGLGISFLKHIERTATLVHLIDASVLTEENSDSACITAFEQINKELHHFSDTLAEKPQLVVLNKVDAVGDRSLLEPSMLYFKSAGYKCLAISGVSNEGVPELIDVLASGLAEKAALEKDAAPIDEDHWED